MIKPVKSLFNYLEEKLLEIPETHFRAIEAHHVHLKQLFEKITMKFV